MRTIQLLLLGASVTMTAAACDRRDPTGHVGQTTITSGTPDDYYGYSHDRSKNAGQQNTPSMLSVGDPNDAAMNDIAHALCARERSCGRVGEKKTYEDDGACLRAMRLGIFGDLQQSECRTTRPEDVRACLNAIQAQQCDAAGDAMQTPECRKDTMCSSD